MRTRWVSRIVMTAALLAIVGCGNRTKVSDLGLAAAVLPEADLVMQVDAKALQAAPITKDMQSLQAMMQGGLSEDEWRQIELAIGITREDIVRISGSLDFDGLMNPSGAAEPSFAKMPAVLGVELAKALSPKRLGTALRAQAFVEKSGATIEPFRHNGLDAVRISGELNAKEAGTETLVVGFAPNNKLLFVGSEVGVTQALDRLRLGAGEQAPNPTFATAEAALPAHQVLVVFAPSAQMMQQYLQFIGKMQEGLPAEAERQKQIAELEQQIAQVSQAPAGQGAVPEGQMARAIKQQQAALTFLQHQVQVLDAADEVTAIAFGADASDTVTYTLSFLFKEAQPATQIVEFAEAESGILLPEQPAPNATELARVRPTFATEGSVAKVSVTLTKAQLEELMTLANQMKQGGGMPGLPGGPAPTEPTEPAAPAETGT